MISDGFEESESPFGNGVMNNDHGAYPRGLYFRPRSSGLMIYLFLFLFI